MRITKLHKKIFWSLFLTIDFFVILIIGAMFFHLLPDYSLGQKEKAHLIGACYMTMNNEFYSIVSEAVNSRVEAEGDQIIIRDPALNVDRQVEELNDLIDMGVDALIITPVDWKSLSPVLKRARDKNIKIVIVDSNISDEDLVDASITSDNYQIGQVIGDYFLSQMPKAELVLMTHNAAKSGRDRIQGFEDKISANKNIHVVSRIDCEGQTEIAMPKIQEFIDTGTYFDSVFCLNDPASVGVVAALDNNGLLNRVKVYGVDASPDSKALIYEGMMEATVAQYPMEIGKKAAETVYDLFDGKEVDRDVKIGVELINRENVSSHGIGRWQ